jgi:steroid 5-alpha reductase family enzyme
MIIALIPLILFFHVVFFIAIKIKDNSIADIAWGLGFIVIDVALILQTKTIHTPQLIMSLLIMIWGLRLSGYIYLRKRNMPEDFRYQEFRKKWGAHYIIGSYLQVFLLQMFLLLLIATPLFIAHENDSVFSLYTLFGAIIAVIGFSMEVLSDFQMAQFKKDVKNKGKIIQTGLWRYSRHPNYFGESLFWWGIACIAYPLSNHFLWLISPIVITILVRYISGVPLLEKKYQSNPEFQLYAKRTACFVPWFNKKG